MPQRRERESYAVVTKTRSVRKDLLTNLKKKSVSKFYRHIVTFALRKVLHSHCSLSPLFHSLGDFQMLLLLLSGVT